MPPGRATPVRRKKSPAARAFLFSDLRDYTSYVEAKGDAAAARLLREYRTLVRREVARHAGAEVKTEGDSFYVVFDSASSAIECAVEILRAADAQNQRDPSMPLRIGVGLHAGETVEYDDQFVGSAVNIASRLAGKAGAMELVISDTVRGLVRTSQQLAMTDRGPLELKGVAEPIRAWSVDWRPAQVASAAPAAAPSTMASAPPAAPATGQLLCPVVVGRTAETATFATALAAALGGAGQTVVLGGEAGVGKSKFVREAQERATANGARVLVGLTHQADSTLPYAPFVSAIRSGFHGLDRDELGRVLQRSAPDLAELFPELGRIERAVTPTGLERHRLTVAFQHLFRAFAREAPVLVVLEDLHWADETSLELLQHLARELRDSRVLILATYRSDEMHRRHPFLRTLAELQRERVVTEIQLKRLTPDETRELIRATFAARDPNVKVSEEFRDAVYARSEGNPFFTEELLKAIVDSGGVYWQDGDRGWARKPIDQIAIPGSIREAVRARIEELSPEARDTLSAAAAIGHRFSFELLRDVTGADERALETRIREFIELQLVTDASGGDEEHAFRHALTREVVYDDLLVRERKRLHRGVADALERHRDAEPALLAHHLLAAGEQDRAVPKLLEAARRAERADAPRDAAAHLERVVEIGVPDEQLPDVLEQLAEAYQHFDETRSLKAAIEAAAAFEQRGDRRGRSRALRLASRQSWLRGEHEQANALAQQAIDVLDGEESVELARALAHLSGLHMTAGRRSRSVEVADQAIALAERFNDLFALSNALVTKGTSMAANSEQVQEAVSLIDRGRSVAMEAGLVTTAARAWNNQSLWLSFLGWPIERQLAFVREGIAYARSHGQERSSVAWLQRGLADLLAQSGDLEGALAAWEQVRQGSEYLGNAVGLTRMAIDGPQAVRASALEAATRWQRGDPQQYVPSVGVAALVLALCGDIDEARDLAQGVLDRCEDEGVAEIVAGPWHALLSCVALATGIHGILDVIATPRPVPAERARVMRAAAVDVGAGIRDGDLASAGTALDRYWQTATALGFAFGASLFIVNTAIIAGMATVANVPEWSGPLRSAREFATKAKARWWLEQLTA